MNIIRRRDYVNKTIYMVSDGLTYVKYKGKEEFELVNGWNMKDIKYMFNGEECLHYWDGEPITIERGEY